MKELAHGVSIIVPVYNGEGSLAHLIGRLDNVLKNNFKDYEMILINDGSKDFSWSIITQLKTQYSKLIGIDLMRNYGQHNALLCGIKEAKYDITVTMDDDLQHPPEEIIKLLNELNKENCDVVYGKPPTEQHGLLRNIASRITKLALKVTMGVDIASNVSSFRMFRTKLREAFKNYRSSFISIDVLLSWATNKFSYIEVLHKERYFGQSNYTFGKLITHAINMFTGYSTIPLQIASILGFSFAIFGIVILVFVVSTYLIQGTPVQGFPFIASIISIFSGAQLMAVGIIGEYLSRLYFKSMEKPVFTIREIVN